MFMEDNEISEVFRMLEYREKCTITKENLIKKMEMLPDKFWFIKCLNKFDIDAFIDKYISICNTDATQMKYYDNGVIKVSTWLKIMNEIELQNNYRIYRNAYSSENTGSKIVSLLKVNYKCMLVEFGSNHICTVDLLIANRHISRIYLFKQSSFVNVKQWFWDKIIG